MRRVVPFIIALLIASGIAGWLRANASTGSAPPVIDGWEAMQYQPPSKSDYDVMTRRIKASSLLPLSLIAEGRQGPADTQVDLAPDAPPKFPKIIGYSSPNKVPHIHFLDADKTLVKVTAGDVLESGWEIKSITSKQVSAVFDGEEIDVAIVAYMQEAFEKPAKDVNDDTAGQDGAPNKTTQNITGGGE